MKNKTTYYVSAFYSGCVYTKAGIMTFTLEHEKVNKKNITDFICLCEFKAKERLLTKVFSIKILSWSVIND